eukprot:gene14641-11040_t
MEEMAPDVQRSHSTRGADSAGCDSIDDSAEQDKGSERTEDTTDGRPPLPRSQTMPATDDEKGGVQVLRVQRIERYAEHQIYYRLNEAMRNSSGIVIEDRPSAATHDGRLRRRDGGQGVEWVLDGGARDWGYGALLLAEARPMRERLFSWHAHFVIESSLDEDTAQLVGRDTLQVYRLLELSPLAALSREVRRMMLDVPTRAHDAARRVAVLFAVAEHLADDDAAKAAAAAGVVVTAALTRMGADVAAAADAALVAAAEGGHADAVAPLVALGARADAAEGGGSAPDDDGPRRASDAAAAHRPPLPPLHVAARNGHADVVTALLDAGAQPMRTAGGKSAVTAAEAAHRRGHAHVAAVLAQRGGLPPSLRRAYARWPRWRAWAAAAAALLRASPWADGRAGAAAPADDAFHYVGPGTCADAWGSPFKSEWVFATPDASCGLCGRPPPPAVGPTALADGDTGSCVTVSPRAAAVMELQLPARIAAVRLHTASPDVTVSVHGVACPSRFAIANWCAPPLLAPIDDEG